MIVLLKIFIEKALKEQMFHFPLLKYKIKMKIFENLNYL